MLVGGYAAIIALGTLLLALPVSAASGEWSPLGTAFFTATSAVCVTGLIVVDTATYFSAFGKSVILLLIQIGGLGYATAYIFIVILLGRKLSSGAQQTVKTGFNLPSIGRLRPVVLMAVTVTVVFELLGFLVMLPSFAARRGIGAGFFDSLFQAVSSFNNAGFSTYSDSLASFSNDPLVGIIMPALAILGGIGFIVLVDLWDRFVARKRHGLSLHSIVVLRATAWLIAASFVLVLFFEWNNPATLGAGPPGERLLKALGMAVFPRTCGFSAVDYAVITPGTYLVTLLLMVIGASPGGTGGGVKTTTSFIVSLATLNVFRRRTSTVLYHRKLPAGVLLNAYALVAVWFATLAAVTVIIAHIEPFSVHEVMFETVSALGTVGLSQGITAQLSAASRVLLSLLMVAGRVGPITAGSIAFGQAEPDAVHYPVEDVLVG